MTNERTEIAVRRTFDGVRLAVWSDGAITLGHEYNNRLVARGLPRHVAFAVADDVCLYDAAEVKALVKAARKAESCRRPAHWIAGWQGDAEMVRLMRVFAVGMVPRAELAVSA